MHSEQTSQTYSLLKYTIHIDIPLKHNNQSIINTINMHQYKLFNIHTYTQHVTWKPIWEKPQGALHLALAWGNRCTFCLHTKLQTLFKILSSIFTYFSSLSCSLIFSLSHSTLLLPSDPHTAWIDPTFSTYLRTHLQNHYSYALTDTYSLL